jgi:4-amino-4-deoxy-L-arabinose transferase-like glycosyltransferase
VTEKRVTRPWRPGWIALAAILVLAAALRLTGIRYGLPLPVLNPDEANIVPRGWRMGHGHLDPGWYDYPSLLMALLAPVQAVFSSPSYLAGRLVAVALGLGGVGATWWLGRRAYGTGAAIVGAATVAVATTHVAYSRMAVTDVLLTLAVTCALALAVEGRLEWAGLAVGLAASAKYPGVLTAVPVVVAGWGRWRVLGRAALLAVAGFALTSPFVLVHAGAAWDDISRVQRLARKGWLGFENDPVTPFAYIDRLWSAVGPFLVVAAATVVVAAVRRSRADLVLLSFALAYWLWLMPQAAHFDRYVLPLVPVLGVLAGSVRVVVPVALVALVVPLVWSIGDARDLTRTDTRLRADAWVETHVPRGQRIAADPSTLPLKGRPVTRLQLPGPGRPTDRRRDLARLRALGVRWVVVSGAVTDRVLAARGDYPLETRFYRELARDRAPAFAVTPGEHGLAGPWVRVYRLQ